MVKTLLGYLTWALVGKVTLGLFVLVVVIVLVVFASCFPLYLWAAGRGKEIRDLDEKDFADFLAEQEKDRLNQLSLSQNLNQSL